MVFHRETGEREKTRTTTRNKQKEQKVKLSESIMLIDVSMTLRHHFQIGTVPDSPLQKL